MPTSGLGSQRSQTPRTSANLRLLRKCARKARELAVAREKLQSLPMMIAQDTSEKNARTTSTAFAVGPALRNSCTRFDPFASDMCVLSASLEIGGWNPRRSGRRPSRQGSTETRRGSKRWAVFAALALALAPALGAAAAPLPADVLPLSAVHAGMQGWGLTVMKGSVPERFEVEVLGILPNTLGRTRILVKVSGLGLEKTGVIAGMSGSPVYLEGKLAGALSATWAFGKDPIGQV